ncbi:(deoxy)nucleoside triphosphate pyrophosphohydrolase [Breznakiellaceae bacterium SP9]
MEKDTLRSIAGIAIEGNSVFVAKRVSGGALGGKWEFPGGKVDEGETDERALVREYWEEFRVPIQVGDFLGSAQFEHNGKSRSVHAYRITLLGKDVFLSVHTEWRWVPLEELAGLEFAPSDVKLFPAILASVVQ